jgi:hypothetical protein
VLRLLGSGVCNRTMVALLRLPSGRPLPKLLPGANLWRVFPVFLDSLMPSLMPKPPYWAFPAPWLRRNVSPERPKHPGPSLFPSR